MVDANNIAISSSYDRSLLVWNLNTASYEAALFDGHDDAVMTFDWQNSLCVSGDRKGGVTVWDINTAKPVSITKPHKVKQLLKYRVNWAKLSCFQTEPTRIST